MNIVNSVKKSLVFIMVIHIILMLISMIKNGPSTTYFSLFFLSVLLFGSIIFIYSRLMRNLDCPNYFIILFVCDVIILGSFVYSLLGERESILSSYIVWVAVPLRNIMVFFSKVYNIRASAKQD